MRNDTELHLTSHRFIRWKECFSLTITPTLQRDLTCLLALAFQRLKFRSVQNFASCIMIIIYVTVKPNKWIHFLFAHSKWLLKLRRVFSSHQLLVLFWIPWASFTIFCDRVLKLSRIIIMQWQIKFHPLFRLITDLVPKQKSQMAQATAQAPSRCTDNLRLGIPQPFSALLRRIRALQLLPVRILQYRFLDMRKATSSSAPLCLAS